MQHFWVHTFALNPFFRTMYSRVRYAWKSPAICRQDTSQALSSSICGCYHTCGCRCLLRRVFPPSHMQAAFVIGDEQVSFAL